MHAQDFLAAVHIRQIDRDLAVETPRTKQCWVEHVWAVGGGDDDYAFLGVEAVHLDQQLVERLLAFVVATAHTVAAVSADRIDLIDKDKARRVLFALFEHVANARGADADKHFDEVRSGDREKRHIRLTGDRARQQGLTRTWRANHQHALWNRSAKLLKLTWVLEEIDDFKQLLFRFLNAGDIFEGHFVAIHREQARLAFAKRHRTTARRFHLLAEKEEQHTDHQQKWQEGEEGVFKIVRRSVVSGLALNQSFEVISQNRNGNCHRKRRGFKRLAAGIHRRDHVGDHLAGADHHRFTAVGLGKDAQRVFKII